MRSMNRLKSRIFRFIGSSGSLVRSNSARAAGSLGGVAQAETTSTNPINAPDPSHRGLQDTCSTSSNPLAPGFAHSLGERRMVDKAEHECNSNFNARGSLKSGPSKPETADEP